MATYVCPVLQPTKIDTSYTLLQNYSTSIHRADSLASVNADEARLEMGRRSERKEVEQLIRNFPRLLKNADESWRSSKKGALLLAMRSYRKASVKHSRALSMSVDKIHSVIS